MKSVIRASNLWGYDEFVAERGADPAVLLKKHALPLREERTDSQFLPYIEVIRLIEETAIVLDDLEFGLNLAKYQGLEILGPISVIARSSPTLGTALDSISKYLYFHCTAIKSGIDVETYADSNIAAMHFEIDEKAVRNKSQGYELTLAEGMQVLRLLYGEKVTPDRVFFMHAQQGSDQAYRDTFGCEVLFEQSWCGLHLPLSILNEPLNSADHQTWQVAETYLESFHAQRPSSVSGQVLDLIKKLLPTNQCNSQVIANHLAMHKRTLSRRLAAEGTTYEQLLDNERSEQAEIYLQQANMRFDQIAGLLGYSEQSVFNRACRKWFDMTPSEYRRSKNIN